MNENRQKPWIEKFNKHSDDKFYCIQRYDPPADSRRWVVQLKYWTPYAGDKLLKFTVPDNWYHGYEKSLQIAFKVKEYLFNELIRFDEVYSDGTYGAVLTEPFIEAVKAGVKKLQIEHRTQFPTPKQNKRK